MQNPAFGGQFGPENKLIEGQPNEYDVICNDICRRAVPATKYLPERRSTAFPHHYTPGFINPACRRILIYTG